MTALHRYLDILGFLYQESKLDNIWIRAWRMAEQSEIPAPEWVKEARDARLDDHESPENLEISGLFSDALIGDRRFPESWLTSRGGPSKGRVNRARKWMDEFYYPGGDEPTADDKALGTARRRDPWIELPNSELLHGKPGAPRKGSTEDSSRELLRQILDRSDREG